MGTRSWTTERILARPPEDGDRAAYLKLFRDPSVEEWLRPGPMPPFAEADLVAMLRDDIEHWENHGFGPWMLTGRTSEEPLGRGGLRWTTVGDRLEVELPWTVGSSQQGRGLATEAASAALEWAAALRLSEVVALILPGNRASRRVAEKIGLGLRGETEHAGLTHLVYRRALGEGA